MFARRFGVVLIALLQCAMATAAAASVRLYRHEGMIHGVTAAIIEDVLDTAAKKNDALVIVELDTPGGLVDASEQIVRAILNSPVPVCVYVAPRGAHAASAGFFLLLAADIAAMSPLTRTGAAHPITAGGPNAPDDIALKKVAEDLSALIRSTATQRGRPPEIAERAVRDATSWTAEEALQNRLIDLIAGDGKDLLRQLDGRIVVRPDGSRVTLELANATIVRHEIEWGKRIAGVVLHPVVMALLLSIATLAIYIELTHPGLILPGVVGVVALLVFLYGSSILPVNFLAAALIAVGVVMFILEIKVTSYGMLSLGGGAAILVGLYLLFPRGVPGLSLPLGSLVPVALTLIGALSAVTWIVSRAQRSPVMTGREQMIGAIAVTNTELAPEGKVFVHGELWSAKSERPTPAGTRVRVVGAKGLQLTVEPLAPTDDESGASRR
ncbi:MAG: nodulation protein NfeD [Acidobacteriota bacterium]